MDGVIVDFAGYLSALQEHARPGEEITGETIKAMPGAYLMMQAIPGAIAAVRSLIGMGFEVWIATKPPTGVPHAYADKAAWVLKHLPELKRRIIITHDKGLLGDECDYLIDDRPHKANCQETRGTLLVYQAGRQEWPEILQVFRQVCDPEGYRLKRVPSIELDGATYLGKPE